MIFRTNTLPYIFVVCSLLFSLLLGIPSLGLANNKNLIENLDKIEVRINQTKRTKQSLIKDLVYDCIEDERMDTWQEVVPETIEQCLLNSKLFSRVTATVDVPVIQVEVDERWTLLPIPYMYSSGDDYTFGLFLMENNLFGLGKKGGIGGNISANGNSFFLFYFDPSINFSDWSTSFRLGNMVKEPLLEYDDREYYSYEVTDFSYGFNS